MLVFIGSLAFSLCTALLLLAGILWAVEVPSASPLVVLGLFVPVLMAGSFLGFLLRWQRKGQLVNFHLLVLISSFVLMGSFYQFGRPVEGSGNPDGKTFSVLSFNTREFNMNGGLPTEDIDTLIIDFIRKEDADIVCLQECNYNMKGSDVIADQYPYKFVDFVYSYTVKNDHVIHGIFSKYPLIRSEVIDFPGSANRAVCADILNGGDTLRVYSVHLQSYKIVPDRDLIEKESYREVLLRMSEVIRTQHDQAEIIRRHIDSSPYPSIVTGDLNNTQFSRVYQLIKKDMGDSHRARGRGFGRTFDLYGFPMRIDFILADPDLEFLAHRNYDVQLSDHYPIKAVLQKKSE